MSHNFLDSIFPTDGAHECHTQKVKVDGDPVVYVLDSGTKRYSKFEDGVQYNYVYLNEQWMRFEGNKHKPVQIGQKTVIKTELWEKLLDWRNYERTGLLSWRISPRIDMGNMYNVELTYFPGCYIFTWRENGQDYTMTFQSFGLTHISPPWEK